MAAFVSRLVRPAALRFSMANRRRKGTAISRWMSAHDCQTVLLIGVGAEDGPPNRNVVEQEIANNRKVVAAINIQPQRSRFPLVRADARHLPFVDCSVDFALSNAIIEHVGGEADQRQMVAEQSRVARCWAITTPNRWFPVESHTSAVLVHWSPSWRARRPEFTRLLSRSEFKRLLPPGATVVGHWWSPTFTAFFAPTVTSRPIAPAAQSQ